MRTETKNRLLMATVVWGNWHLWIHLEVNLPTLLAEGNLPSLARRYRITYLLFTQKSDVERVQSAPQVKALRDLMDVEIGILDQEDLADPIKAAHKAWDIALRGAKQ